jgi:hypothetical protein
MAIIRSTFASTIASRSYAFPIMNELLAKRDERITTRLIEISLSWFRLNIILLIMMNALPHLNTALTILKM